MDSAPEIEAIVEGAARAQGLNVDADALDWIVTRLGGDRGQTRNEIDKLMLYKAGDEAKTITLEDAMAVLGDTAAIGIDTVVAQFAIVKDHYRNYPTQLSWATNFPDHSACISNLLSAAQTKGLDAYLGLYFDEKPWWGTPNDAYLSEQAHRCNAVVEELERLYGSHPRLKGYYLPHEVVLYYWQKPADLRRLVTQFLKPVEAFIHGQSTKTLVMSPFYNQALEQPAQTEAFFNSLFDGFHPDIVAPQDGVGVAHATIANEGSYLQAIKNAASAHAIASWVNVELFQSAKQQTPASWNDRVKHQVTTAAGICAKLISYEYYQFNNAKDPAKVSALYNDYKTYITVP
jgi:hypothetical protein